MEILISGAPLLASGGLSPFPEILTGKHTSLAGWFWDGRGACQGFLLTGQTLGWGLDGEHGLRCKFGSEGMAGQGAGGLTGNEIVS